MNFLLTGHADYPPRSLSVSVDLRRSGHILTLTYAVTDGDIRWPRPATPGRADGLWRTTCFELFLRFDDDERYVEFNFSPSTRWAAYAFDGYRDGMKPLDVTPPPIERTPTGIVATVDLGDLPRGEHRMALTAVIEEIDGTQSYWSLAHPPGAPDFHHPACFVARLPAPDAA